MKITLIGCPFRTTYGGYISSLRLALQRTAGSPESIREALRRAGLTLVGWDVRSFDKLGSARWVIERVVRKTRDGSIILLHDGGVPVQRVLEIVNVAVRELRLRGFEFERVDRMLECGGEPQTPPPESCRLKSAGR